MSKPLWIGIGAGLLACMGCATTAPEKAAPATVRALTPPPPPVTVEMITIANRHQMLQAVTEEVDRETQGRRLVPGP